VASRHSHYVPSVTMRLHAPPGGEQMWTSAINNEAHFNLAARGPGTYKIW